MVVLADLLVQLACAPRPARADPGYTTYVGRWLSVVAPDHRTW